MRVPAQKPHLLRGGFTLIEMLLVIAIMSILMVLSFNSIHNLVGSTDLSTSAVTVVDALNMARQRALSMNHPVEVRFYKVPPKTGSAPSGSPTAYRALGIYEINENGPRLMQKLVYLANSAEFSNSASFGTLLSFTPLASADLSIGGSTLTCDYHCFQFLPDGTTNLDLQPASASDTWHVMIFNSNHPPTSSTPPANYVSIQLDPVSGRTETFQPGGG